MAYPVLKPIDSLDVDQDVKERVSLNLRRIVDGSEEVYRSALANDLDPYEVLESWSKIFDSKMSALEPNLIDLENSQKLKFGPRSIAKPWKERRESLLEYYRDSDHAEPIISGEKQATLRPLGVKEASRYLKSNTSSGLPFLKRKGLVKEKTLSLMAEGGLPDYPSMLFTRTQEQGKTRNVWGMDMKTTLNEMCYYQPLLGYQRQLPWRKALVTPDAVDEAITKLFNARSRGSTLVSIDFSSYDASINPSMQMRAFEFISSLFQKGFDGLIDIANRFQSIEIVTPDGIMEGTHGVPSGSTFTNEVDSIVQYQAVNHEIIEPNYQIQGDDGLYLTSNPDDVIGSFQDVGLKVNEDKSIVSDQYCLFLQNYYSPNVSVDGIIRRVYPTYRALNRILFQERWSDFEDYGIKGSDYYAIRTISILENVRYHPLFREIVQFIYNLDKFKLRYSQKGLNKYIDRLNKTSGLQDVFSNQLGDNLRGINDFETVKLLKTFS